MLDLTVGQTVGLALGLTVWPDCYTWLLDLTVIPDCWRDFLAWLLYLTVGLTVIPDCWPDYLAWLLHLTIGLTVILTIIPDCWPDYLAWLLYLTVIPDCWPDYLAWLLAWVCCSEQARGGWPAAVLQPGCQDCPGMFQVSHTNTCLPIFLRKKAKKQNERRQISVLLN